MNGQVAVAGQVAPVAGMVQTPGVMQAPAPVVSGGGLMADSASAGVAGFMQEQMQAYKAAAYLAEGLAASNLVPKAYQGQPANVALIIMHGAALGLSAVQSLSGIYAYDGRPGLEAKTMAAILMQHGYRIETVESTPQACTLRFTAPDGTVHEESKTIEWAKGMGYAQKAMWAKDPGHMLYQRCIAYGARKVAPNLLLGMPYTVDELQDMDTADGAPKRTRKRKAAKQPPAPVPPAPPAPPADDAPAAVVLPELLKGASDTYYQLTTMLEEITIPEAVVSFYQEAAKQDALTADELASFKAVAEARYKMLGGVINAG